MKASLQDWKKYLARYGLKSNTIKKYHLKHRGDFKALFELIEKYREKRIKEKRYLQEYSIRSVEKALDMATMSVNDMVKNIKQEGNSNRPIVFDVGVVMAEKYITDNVALYVKEAELKDFDALIEIIGSYKAQYTKKKRLKDKLCGDTFHDKSKNARKILSEAQELLKLMDSDIVLPPFQENLYDNVLENETKAKVSELNIKFDTTHTLDKLLEEVSKI
ncbi:hypothetical protein [Sulfuricurvum sp.]|uniref:hypothetical protein n=1 Tax=Sulfuricurvum sp. TaxID=2025608 RepID=UPI00261B00FB|nr:hypothetical protein [Sulfuricurvum sp.]MDD2267807.1 hypothetical protein [Sulfuricurvum sp.]MDD2783497.1 hypothetical protein [Sulfuricurvum sp.]